LIGFFESQQWDVEKKNYMAEPVPNPNNIKNDYTFRALSSITNRIKWSKNPETAAWLKNSRLLGSNWMTPSAQKEFMRTYKILLLLNKYVSQSQLDTVI